MSAIHLGTRSREQGEAYVVRDHRLPVDRTLFERCALDESEVQYEVFRTLSLGVSTEMLATDAGRRRPLGHRRSP